MAHILVIEDDDIVAELVSEILNGAGHACGYVSNAAEAWRLLKWRRPDLLLLNENMPDETMSDEAGLTFLHRLRTSPEFRDLPVVIVTGTAGPREDRSGQHQGAQGIIRKPVHPRLLTWRINQVLATRSDRSRPREPEEWAEFQLRAPKDGPPRKVFL